MLRVLGSAKQFCDGLTRRDLLRIGGLGVAGLSLPQVFALQAQSAESPRFRLPCFGRAKSVILIHLYGSPSQLEWCDQKPEAPLEIRGELGSISSSLPGVAVCELLPNFGKVLDRTTILRSMTHPYPIHGVAYALTGVAAIDVNMELSPYDARHAPFFGSAAEYVESDAASPPRSLPQNIALPFKFSTRRVGEVPRAGPYAGFLGRQYEPVWTELVGTATKGIKKTLRDMVFTENDPYIGLSHDAYFEIPSASRLLPELTLDRLHARKSLLTQFNAARPLLAQTAAAGRLSRHQERALTMLESGALAKALDLRQESSETRALYGHTLFGQSCLAARRLVEAGGRVISVFWDEFGLAGMGWDTHWNHYPRMRQELCPGFDLGWYGLLTDLDRRGLLDETLVVCTSEHGRTPKMNSAEGGGRDHWAQVYTSLMAGGGARRGHVVGASDNRGAEVADRPISPKDLLATMYHLMGIDPETMLHDPAGRPFKLVEGEVIAEAIA